LARLAAGKTTITRLVYRFWDAWSGAVRVGGVDIRETPTEQLMSRLSLVFQDAYLFSGTIRKNILMAHPDATDDGLHEAIRLVLVDEIIGKNALQHLVDVGRHNCESWQVVKTTLVAPLPHEPGNPRLGWRSSQR
jgi:ABC-type multidrug transport system fused ATPase/permease subunit